MVDNLMIMRFYDIEARDGKLRTSKFPLSSGGILNQVVGCGSVKCWEKAMFLRKQEIENELQENNSTSKK